MTGAVQRRARARAQLDPARLAAYTALRAVEHDDAYLNLALSDFLGADDMSLRDAGFVTELAAGTTRMQGSYDAVLHTCVTGGLAAVTADVLIALRLGCHQILSMRVPGHAAVTTTVELVRREVGERPVRLVNAVLRAVAQRTFDEWVAIVAPSPERDLPGWLSVRYSHPRWIVDTLLGLLPADEIEPALAADNVAPPVTLAVRPGLATVTELEPYGVAPGRWSPYAAVMHAGDPRAVPMLRDGRAGVQDEGSQLAALALARVPVGGEDARWLDMCAGPGGKAGLLAGVAREQAATLVAAERQPHRAQLVKQALRAYAATAPPLVGAEAPVGAPVVVADGARPPWRDATFDRVLVDVPCTGLGALRRRPDARWRRQPGDLDTLVPLQVSLLVSALRLVRPGGAIAYVTCSPHPAETRSVVDTVLRQSDGVAEEDARTSVGVPDVGPGPHVQLWPHRHGTDGMFIAILRRLDDGRPR